jgi:membrane protease YdiL (CAAX protease family)
LLYRALEEWRGLRWAIWGSSIGFGLWHVFGQGPLVGITMVLYGLVFGLIRWRAGGIIGLILVHGAIDFAGVLMTPDLNIPSSIGKIGIASREGILAGMALIVLTPLYVWLLHPRINHLVHPRTA